MLWQWECCWEPVPLIWWTASSGALDVRNLSIKITPVDLFQNTLLCEIWKSSVHSFLWRSDYTKLSLLLNFFLCFTEIKYFDQWQKTVTYIFIPLSLVYVNFHFPQPLRKEIPKSHKSIPFGHPCSGSQSTVPHGHLSLQPCPKYPDEQTPLEQLMP